MYSTPELIPRDPRSHLKNTYRQGHILSSKCCQTTTTSFENIRQSTGKSFKGKPLPCKPVPPKDIQTCHEVDVFHDDLYAQP